MPAGGCLRGAAGLFAPLGAALLRLGSLALAAFLAACRDHADPSVIWSLARGARVLVPNAYDLVWSLDGARIAFVSVRAG